MLALPCSSELVCARCVLSKAQVVVRSWIPMALFVYRLLVAAWGFLLLWIVLWLKFASIVNNIGYVRTLTSTHVNSVSLVSQNHSLGRPIAVEVQSAMGLRWQIAIVGTTQTITHSGPFGYNTLVIAKIWLVHLEANFGSSVLSWGAHGKSFQTLSAVACLPVRLKPLVLLE